MAALYGRFRFRYDVYGHESCSSTVAFPLPGPPFDQVVATALSTAYATSGLQMSEWPLITASAVRL